MAGAALLGTGLFGLHMLGKTLPYAKEYSRQLALMNTLGMRQADIAKVVGDAWRTSYAVPSTTAAQNLEAFRELRSAFGSDAMAQGHASAMLPVVARLQGVMQSLTGKEQHNVGFDMVKAIELRTGVMTTAALQRNAELMSQAIIGMGGTISVADFHGALKMGKMATNKWSDDFTYNYLPTLMQELKTASGGGAQSAGTVLASLYQQMHGRMTKAAMPLWVQGGLVRPEDVVKTSTGQYQMKPGSVAGTSVFEANPFQWVQQFLGPAVNKLMAARHISAETAINSLFSNRNAAFGAYNMYFKAAQYDRDKITIGKADGGYAAYQKLLKTDPELASAALHAQWQNILGQIGFSIMPALVKGSLILVQALQGLSKTMREHPGLVKGLVGAFAGLSVLATLAGGVLLFAGAIAAVNLAMPVLAAAMGGLGVAIGLISWPVTLVVAAVAGVAFAIFELTKHWDATKGVIDNIKTIFGQFWDWLFGKIRDLLHLGPGDGGKDKAHPGMLLHHETLEEQRRRVLAERAKHGLHPNTSDSDAVHSLLHGAGKPANDAGPGWAPGHGPAADHFFGQSPYVPHKQNMSLDVHTTVNLDGHVLARTVNRHNARDLNRASYGGTSADPRASLPMAAGYSNG